MYLPFFRQSSVPALIILIVLVLIGTSQSFAFSHSVASYSHRDTQSSATGSNHMTPMDSASQVTPGRGTPVQGALHHVRGQSMATTAAFALPPHTPEERASSDTPASTFAALYLSDSTAADRYERSESSNAQSQRIPWRIKRQTSLRSLQLTDATIDLSKEQSGTYITLTPTHLSGQGTFTLRADIQQKKSDFIDMTDATSSSSGTHRLVIFPVGNTQTTGTEVIPIAAIADGNASFALDTPVEYGIFEYKLRTDDRQKTWELYGDGTRTSTARAIPTLIDISYQLDQITNHTLRQRMGELRHGRLQGDAWVLGHAGTATIDGAGNRQLGVDMSYQGVQFGIDKRLYGQDGTAYIGIMGGVTSSDQDYSNGHGNASSTHAGLYATYMTSDGYYLDAVGKVARLARDFSVKNSQGHSISGDDDHNAYTASIEAGKRFELRKIHPRKTSQTNFGPSTLGQTPTQVALPAEDGSSRPVESALYAEPRITLLSTLFNESSFTTDNGIQAELDQFISRQATIGTSIGYEYTKPGSFMVRTYLKGAYGREFGEDAPYVLNGQKSTRSFGGNIYEYGAGVSLSVHNTHQLFLDATKTSGKTFDSNQLNAGYSYTF